MFVATCGPILKCDGKVVTVVVGQNNPTAGNDVIYGTAQNDTVNAGAGNDTLNGGNGPGVDVCDGEAGNGDRASFCERVLQIP